MHTIYDESPWQLAPTNTILHGECHDGNEITHEYEGQQAIFQPSEAARFKHKLDYHREDINPALYQCLFEAKLARITTQAWIDDALWSLQSRPQLRMNDAGRSQTGQYHGQEQDLILIRQLLYSLFAAERLYSNTNMTSSLQQEDETETTDIETEEMSAFIKDVRAWILHVSAAYLRLAPLQDRIVLLLHLLQSPGITQWATSLIQYIYQRDDHPWSLFMEEYLIMLSLLFDHSLYQQQQNVDMKPPQWNEDDYLAALDQLGIIYVFDTLCATVLRQQQHSNNYPALFSFADQLVTLLNIGIRTFVEQQYTNAMKRVAQIICQVAQVLIDRVTGSASDNGTKDKKHQQSMDDFLMRVVDGYLQIQDAKVWHFLPALPYHAVSIRALWKIVLSLLDIDDYTEPQDLQHALDNLPNISKILTFLEQSQIQGVFLLGCLSNVVTSISTSATTTTTTEEEKNKDRELTSCLIAIVAYTLFTTAFVDNNLREIYYKDVRDSFGSICTSQPFTISLLLRWTVSHFDTMEGMAVYLFRSLPLSLWKLLQSDLVLLHGLLAEGGPSNSSSTISNIKTTFARYVIEHLNYGYDEEQQDPVLSNSQPWHTRKRPFLPYAIHEELAFMLIDILRLHSPLPDSDKNANLIKAVSISVSSYLPTRTQQLLTTAATRMVSPSSSSSTRTTSSSSTTDNSVIEWSWKIALQLKLYDGTLSERATDIENSITSVFIKDMLHGHTDPTASHGALLVYISFLLSPTSRHFLRFESGNGWDKLLLILRRGRPEAVIQILSDIIPTFFYMHGDDFFNDENVLHFLRQMTDFKADPMLVHAVDMWIPPTIKKTTLFATDMNGIAMMMGSHVWHGMFIDSIDQITQGENGGSTGGGFSYRDLVLHSWIKTLFSKKDWMWNDHFVSAMDCLCKIAFCLRRHDLVRDMLSEEQNKLQHHRQHTGSPKLSPASGQHQQHQLQQNQQRNPLRMIKNMLPDAAYASLLAGEWSLASVTTNNLFRTPGIEQDSLWFAFDVLTLETINEEEERAAVAEACANTDDLTDMDIAAILKLHESRIEKPIDFFTIYRWLQHILICPADHPLMPLFLQMFFSLYYANIEHKGRQVFYGPIFFVKKQDMIEKLRDRIAYLQTYHGQQQTDAKSGSGRGSKQRSATMASNHSDSGGEDRSLYHEDLRRVYYAMWLWLDKTELLDPTFDINSLPKHYCPDLLQSCRQTDQRDTEEKRIKPWQDIQLLWRDFIQYDQLSDLFNEFPWIGSNKFRPISQQEDLHQHLIKHHTVYPPHTLSPPDLQLTKPAQILTSTELLSSSPEALMGSTIETLSQHAKRFREHLEQQRILDVAYLEKLATLYMNTSGSKHVEAPCGKRCKKPAEWDIIVSYAQKDDAVAEQLEENRKQVATRYIFRSVDARICIQALLAFRKFDAIVDQAKQGKRQNGTLVQLGWSCLQYVLKSIFRHDMKRFPPARIVVLHMSRALGEAIMEDASYIPKFFDLISEENNNQQQGDSPVQLVYPAFKPHSDNKHLPATLDRVLRQHSDAQLYLLSRFDMTAWTKSSYANETARGTVYTSLFSHLKPAILQANEPLYKAYGDLVLTLMEASGKSKKPEPVKVLELILKLLVDTVQHSKTDGRPAIVHAFAKKIKESERTNNDTLVALVTLLGNTFNSGKGDPHLFKTYTDSTPVLCQLLQNIFRDPKFTEGQKDGPTFVWRHVGQCFHAWWKSAEDRRQRNVSFSDVFARTYRNVIQFYLNYFDLSGRAKLLNWIFGYYHEKLLQLSSADDDGWIEYYGNTITSTLNWGYFDLSSNHLRRIHQTWSSLRQQGTQQDHRRSIYVNFIWRILLPWMKAHPQPSNVDKDRYDYTQIAFIFVQDGESVWSEANKVRNNALHQLWKTFCRHHTSLSVEQVSNIIRQLRHDWHHPLPLPSAASNNLFIAHCIDWVRRLTCFNEQKALMKRRRLFADYIFKLLSDDDIDMQRAWIQHIYQVANEHTPSETRGEDFEETILLIFSMLPRMHEEIPPGGNPSMLSAVFGALAKLPASFETVGLMENALEQYIINITSVSSSSSSSPDWCRLGELLSRSNPDYSLFLQYCLDQSAFLTMRVYGEAKLQQECGGALQDPARLANLAEEVAAVISIAKVDRKAVVHLVKFFATLFCRSKQQESRLLASIVSLSRTTSRWINAYHHSPKPNLGQEWHVFATLLDGFLASRLIARGVLSPAPTSVDWIKRIELMRSDKKYKPFHSILSKGIEITKEGDRWTIWQLDQAVTEFAQALWIS
ncbi:hypothetical protein BDA99DRAFT_493745 [Phascolomyces articulosus]|uniref:Epg5-like TPR domain-containing protein n=1 Tax=Phascolomyces articulosus TaxID=60185 RepID=A0AAD5KSU9_9FUNG|nr:hypothetical protein BDA99DRAFT_493745 [Phascolomyces articulosus]